MTLVLDWIFDHRWAITEHALQNIVGIVENNDAPEKARQLLHLKDGESLGKTESVTVRNGVAIIDVFGPIFPRANIITEYSGATSLGLLAKDFAVALENPQIKGIVLNMDSPGGEIGGVSEFANMIYNARNKKPIAAYGFNLVASAAYWIASAAGSLIVSETAQVGSIGVATVYRDTRSKESANGVKTHEIVSTVSPNKRPDPATDAGRTEILKELDALAQVFVGAVAKHRNVSADKVVSDFGKGGVLIGQAAVEAGMADGIGSLEDVILSLAAGTAYSAPAGARSVSTPSPSGTATNESEIDASIAAATINTSARLSRQAMIPGSVKHFEAIATRLGQDRAQNIKDREYPYRKKSESPAAAESNIPALADVQIDAAIAAATENTNARFGQASEDKFISIAENAGSMRREGRRIGNPLDEQAKARRAADYAQRRAAFQQQQGA